MTKLYIDTSNTQKITVGIGENKVEEDAKQERSQKLLSIIERELNNNRLKLEDIDSINVNVGPGSFTGLRVGISVANALGWSLGIPVNGKREIVQPKY